jgi:hypothetical protein
VCFWNEVVDCLSGDPSDWLVLVLFMRENAQLSASGGIAAHACVIISVGFSRNCFILYLPDASSVVPGELLEVLPVDVCMLRA